MLQFLQKLKRQIENDFLLIDVLRQCKHFKIDKSMLFHGVEKFSVLLSLDVRKVNKFVELFTNDILGTLNNVLVHYALL